MDCAAKFQRVVFGSFGRPATDLKVGRIIYSRTLAELIDTVRKAEREGHLITKFRLVPQTIRHDAAPVHAIAVTDCKSHHAVSSDRMTAGSVRAKIDMSIAVPDFST